MLVYSDTYPNLQSALVIGEVTYCAIGISLAMIFTFLVLKKDKNACKIEQVSWISREFLYNSKLNWRIILESKNNTSLDLRLKICYPPASDMKAARMFQVTFTCAT